MNRAGWFGIVACFCYFSWRLFVPPLIGIANTGDFAKIAGRLSLGPAGAPDDRFSYVTRDYIRAPRYDWNSRYPSSEFAVAWVADRLSRIFQPAGQFDIRWMGLVHLAAIMLALVWLMAALRPFGPAVQLAAALTGGFALGDAAYLGYCNSFFTDAAALAGVILTTAALVDLAVRGPSRWRLAGIGCCAVLLVTSKTQHALLAVPVAVVIWVLARSRAALAVSLIVLFAAAWLVNSFPASNRAEPIFNLVFDKITPHSPDALKDLSELGLGGDYARYVGLHSYLPGAPTANQDFDADFVGRVTYGRLFRFYVSHPRRTLNILWRDLSQMAPIIQPDEFGNYTADSGRPPHAHASGYWAGFQTKLGARMPWLLPVCLIGAAVLCVAVRSKLSWVCLAVIAMAGIEFATASLMDALDTPRHLLLFHVLVEILFCFAIGAAVREIYRRRSSS